MSIRYVKIFFLAALSCSLITSISHSQDNPYDEISISSPNAASLAKYADIPVNKHTGVPSVAIPIYTIKEGPLKLPISLSYHASGLKVMEPASWVGAGWSLNAGGVITRNVRGTPDERLTSSVQNQEHGYFSNYGYPNYYYKSGNSQDWSAFADGYKDGEPDLYFFNFNGVSGKFYFREDRTPVLLPEQDIHIEPVYCDPACDESISSWVITAPDGTKYYFGKNGDFVEPIDFTRPYTEANGIGFSNTISSWYLNKIVSADQQFEINLDYESEEYSYYTISMFPIGPSSNDDEYKLIKNIVEGVRLSAISYTNGNVDFNEGDSRLDLAGEEQSITEYPNDNSNSSKELSSIKITNDSGHLCKEFLFNQGYFNDSSSSLPGNLDAYSLNTDKKRLKLNSVQQKSCDSSIANPPYSFTYYNESMVSRRITFAQDHWGYFNGVTSNDELIPTYFVDDYNEVIGADREPSWPDMNAGTLKKIERPTGGYTAFEYEPHDTHVNYTVLEDQGTVLSFSAGYDGSELPVEEDLSTSSSSKYKVRLSNSSCHYSYSTCIATLNIESYGYINAEGGESVEEIIDLPGGITTFTLSKNNASTGSGASVTVTEYTDQNYTEDKMVGGLRISKITHSDGTSSNPDIVKEFDYEFNNQSTGILYSRPVYASVLRNDLVKDYGSSGASSPNGCLSLNGQNNPYFISPSSIHPMESTQGNHIGYNEVKVTESDGGYKIFRYYGSSVWDNVDDNITYRRVYPDDCTLDIPNYPAAPNQHEFYRGQLKYKGFFDASGLIQKSYEYFPTFEEEEIGAPAFISTNYNTGSGNRLLGTKYEMKTSKKTKMKVIESLYGDTGGDPVQKSTTTTFYNSDYHALPTKTTTIGNSDSTETHTQYIADIRISSCESISYTCDTNLANDQSSCLNTYYSDKQNCNGNENCEFQAWLDYESCQITASQNYRSCRQSYQGNFDSCRQNAYSSADFKLKPILDLKYRHQVGSKVETSSWRNDQFLGSMFYDYRIFDSNPDLVYPKYIRKIFTDTPLSAGSFNPADESSGTVNIDGDYELERTLDFDGGNLTEIDIAGGTVTSYVWEDNYPVVKAIGVDYSALLNAYNAVSGNLSSLRNQSSIEDALLSTYTYEPHVGIISMTDHSETAASFSYDDLGRLIETKNDADQKLTDHTYTYTGSGFSASNPNRIKVIAYPGTGSNRFNTEYIDGLGRGYQTHQRDGTDDIISALVFDSNGRNHKQYKSYRFDTNHSFDVNYDSHAQSEHGDSYPFVENIYQSSAMNRVSEVIPEGGESFSGKVSTDYDVKTWNNDEYFVTTVIDESGKVTETWTDVWGRNVRTIADPGGIDAETRFQYNAFDQLNVVTAPNNLSTTYNYDPRGRLDEKTSPDAGTTEKEYDKTGNLRFSQDAVQALEGDVIFMTYDFANRPLFEGIDAATFSNLDGSSSYGFESDTTNIHGAWAYDSKPSTGSFPWGNFPQIDSKSVGNPKGQLVARAWRFGGSGVAQTASVGGIGITGSETYQAASSLEVSNTIVDPGASLTLTSGGTITLGPGFHAEAGSALNASIDPSLATAATEGVSSVTGSNPWQAEIYSYDSEGRLAEKWIWTGNRSEWDTHLTYHYNRQGEIIKRKVKVDNDSLYQHYMYNQLGLLASVTVTMDGIVDSESPEVIYSYTASGAIENIDYKGSKDADFGYTIRDWVASINDTGSPGGNFAADYIYTDNGNVENAQYHNPQVQSGGGANTHSWDFGYDGLNRLADADFGADGAGPFDLAGLGYDDAGNITGLQRRDETGSMIDNLSYTYTGSNRLQSVGDAVPTTTPDWDSEDASFTYDASGNLTAQSGKLDDIAYEHRNLPLQFALATDDTLIANYNADGQRILKELKGGAWQFYIMDGMQTLAVIDNTGLSHFNLVGNGTFGRWEPGGTRRYYLTDHLGSTRAVVDDAGTVLETFDYYPFGLLMPARSTTSGNTLEKFTGKERDEAIGLDYFGARYYDPALARWHSVDPLADDYPSWNPYTYTLNDPINLIDPDGKQVDCPSCPMRESLEAAFGPITSFISNLILPDQTTASVSVELGRGNQSTKIGGEVTSVTQFDGNGLPTGVDNIMESVLETGGNAGPVGIFTDGETSTTSIDAGMASGELQLSESGFEKAGINAGGKNFSPGISIDKQGRTGFNVEGEAEGRIGSFFIKVKGKIESIFNPFRAVENTAKTSTGIEKRLRQK